LPVWKWAAAAGWEATCVGVASAVGAGNSAARVEVGITSKGGCLAGREVGMGAVVGLAVGVDNVKGPQASIASSSKKRAGKWIRLLTIGIPL